MAVLKEIKIKNYKAIKEANSIGEITKLFAVIGKNNTGKSAFLKAIRVLFAQRDPVLADFHKDTPEDIEISGVITKGFGESRTEQNIKVVAKKDGDVEYFIEGAKISSKTKYRNALPKLLVVEDIRNPGDSTTDTKSTLLAQIMELKAQDIGDSTSQELADITTRMYDLKKQESREISKMITKKFREIVDEDSFTVSIEPNIDMAKAVKYKTALTDDDIPQRATVDITESGTGVQSMYLLALLEIYGELDGVLDEAILVVEEPEVYLHPEYQRQMFDALRAIASKNQVIFSTHSPIMISKLWLTESVRHVHLNAIGETQLDKVKIEDVINELGIRYEDLLNPSLILFVEGPNDEKFYSRLGLNNSSLKIIPTDDFRAIQCFAFIKLMTSENVQGKFVILADSDGCTVDEKILEVRKGIEDQFNTVPVNLASRIDGRIFILDEYEIEGYFLHGDTLIKAFPKIDPSKIREFISGYTKHRDIRLQEVRNKKLDRNVYQQYCRPSILFEQLYADKVAPYNEFWKGYDDFLTVRQEIADACTELGRTAVNPFEHMLNFVNFDDIPELVTKRDAILAIQAS